MACSGLSGDYLCEGWRSRAAAIIARDGGRCRGCNRTAEEVRLEVHHRRYGAAGACGACVLTGVTDDDLVTLCGGPGGCHEVITNVRRTLRYGARVIEPVAVDPPRQRPAAFRVRAEIAVEAVAAPPPHRPIPVRRRQVW